ncbi:ATP-dependent DNA helicase RecG [Ferrovum myxofaciens]|uniref:ATP-dependent DNA helicase RecG n=1 Tax=Ferrovum myxofaciens TaxID=416213 RepID=UPI003EBA3D4D
MLLPPTAPLSALNLTPRLCNLLHTLGLHSGFDLLLHLPLRYEDERHPRSVATLTPGQSACLIVQVIRHEIRQGPHRTLTVQVRDETGLLELRFLHFYPSQLRLFAPGNRLRLFGEARQSYQGLEMIHPRCQLFKENSPLPATLTPVYPTCAGLSQTILRRALLRALTQLDLTDTLDPSWRNSLGLPDLATTLKILHGPTDAFQLVPALWQRLKFDELLAQQLSMHFHRQHRTETLAYAYPIQGKLSRRLERSLPFPLTAAQHRVVEEIRQDLAQERPMHRLLQGDVGCGKTIVAALAAVQCIEGGGQVALMAPTELLAQQHHAKLYDLLTSQGICIELLTGQLKSQAQHHLRQRLANGEISLVIGTHALIQERVSFKTLGLIIIDEQHRFGVAQRLSLHQKGGESTRIQPHQLMMSATPIPRSLSMSYYADLDVSVIDELPPGRQGITTKLVSTARRNEVIEGIRSACRQGHQAYWVCPLIEESEFLDLQNAQATFQTLTADAPDLRCELLHGRLAGAEKRNIMNRFLKGELQLLVATSVIEVGVDVPNATLMVIEHTERMGLAQLHQMRGRVGRGTRPGVCLLLYRPPLSELARQRLKVIYEHTDGFEIARQDLLLRGPGDYLGSRQSGLALLRFADPVQDDDLLTLARRYAATWIADAPAKALHHVACWLGTRQPYLTS